MIKIDTKVQAALRIQKETYEKIRFISKKEKRSLNSMMEYIFLQYIRQYEKENGPIPVEPIEID